MMTDRELYEAFVQGQISAFEELVLRYRPRLLFFISKLVGNIDTAEELAQDVFAYLYVYREKYDGVHSFSSFLYLLAHRRGVDFIRRQSKVMLVDELPEQEAGEELERELLRSEDRLAVARCMRRLKPEYQEILYLVYFEEMPHKEAAQVLGKTQPQVKMLVHRARKALEKTLEKEGFRYEK